MHFTPLHHEIQFSNQNVGFKMSGSFKNENYVQCLAILKHIGSSYGSGRGATSLIWSKQPK